MSDYERWTQGRLVETIVDNGDGTGVRQTFDPDGNVTSTEQLTGLPIPVEPEPTLEEQVAELQAIIRALLGAP